MNAVRTARRAGARQARVLFVGGGEATNDARRAAAEDGTVEAGLE